MKAYYNENDAGAAAWLRELCAGGLIPGGRVDERSIKDVRGEDVSGYGQCHFFGGIGGWPYALRLAGWPDDGPVWTGSCPCQPFSAAGKRRGAEDERHLWPEFRRLIAERRPAVVFGEQVAGPAGRLWLSGVRADLEALGYAVGAADLCAASVGAPHIRQRLFWVADLQGDGWRAGGQDGGGAGAGDGAGAGAVPRRSGEDGRMDGDGAWEDADWLLCRDGRWRRVEPGTFPLADGVSGRVGMLRGYGNAIVPQLAAEFVGAWMEARGWRRRSSA